MADQSFIDGLKTELGKLNDPELTALRNDVNELKARPVAPSPKAYITETGSSSRGWWRKYSDGYIEQSFISINVNQTGAYDGGVTVSLIVPFKTQNYSIQGLSITEPQNVGFGAGLAIRARTTSSFRAVSYGTASKYLMYCCGY